MYLVDLPKRKLGRTGLSVIALGFGALELRGMIAGVGRELKPRQPEHEDTIAAAARAGMGIVIRGGVAKGPPGKGQGSAALWDLWDKAELDELLDGEHPTEFMLRFTITNPDIHTTVVGTLDPEHLLENIASVVRGPLPASLCSEAKRRLVGAQAA